MNDIPVATESPNAVLSDLDNALESWARRHGADKLVARAFALANRAVSQGHTCLLLDDIPPALMNATDKQALPAALAASDLVGTIGDVCPLIFVNEQQLYLQRYWAYEQQLANWLNRHIQAEPDSTIDTARLRRSGGLFNYDWVADAETNWQAVAAFVAARHRFAVISGGPGTGKTYTVLRLMCMLIEAAERTGQAAPLIRLAAPTGKAAARMLESIQTGLEHDQLPGATREHIPQQAQTLHRLLGIGHNTTQPRHDTDNPLAADVVIVDEASMIDLPLMAKLTAALPDHARLILLGDRYQLDSVESGSVLSQLCDATGVNSFTETQQRDADTLLAQPVDTTRTALGDHIVTLQTSHRFHRDSAIGQLAAAINNGDTDTAIRIAASATDDIELVTDMNTHSIDALVEATARHYAQLQHISDPQTALDLLNQQRLLCAVRHGPTGSQTLNRRITDILAEHQGFDPQTHWYHGRPILITRNDYRNHMFNGDTGVCLTDGNGTVRVWFPTANGPRALLPSTLPAHENVYAMTIHKSQGSEFDHVGIILPATGSPILSRELLYTGITRARHSVQLVSSESVLRHAIDNRITRHSGLRAHLAQAYNP